MPGPASGPPDPGRAELNAQCVQCHPAQADQWQGSLHQRAFVDEDFAHAFARERRPFCRSCHAPEADPAAAPTPALAELGVSCVTCHVPPSAGLPRDAVLASPRSTPAAPAPHPVLRRSTFASADACAGCHEFTASRSPDLQMQSTVTEHRASAFADRSCQSCHMPPTSTGGRAHGFPASRDPRMLRAAIQATAEREGDRVMVSLELGAVGHALPTGDMFRRLVVELCEPDDPMFPLARRILGRRFGGRSAPARRQIADDRLGMPGAPSTIVLTAPDHAHETLLWRVVYERADVTSPGDEPELFDRIVVAHGRVPPSSRPPSP